MACNEILSLVELFVADELKANDASHDFAHIDRVRRLALSLALEVYKIYINLLKLFEIKKILQIIANYKVQLTRRLRFNSTAPL